MFEMGYYEIMIRNGHTGLPQTRCLHVRSDTTVSYSFMRSQHKCVWLLSCESSIITWLHNSGIAPVVWACQLWRAGASACSKPRGDVDVAAIRGNALAHHNARSRIPRSHQRRRNQRRFRRSKVG